MPSASLCARLSAGGRPASSGGGRALWSVRRAAGGERRAVGDGSQALRGPAYRRSARFVGLDGEVETEVGGLVLMEVPFLDGRVQRLVEQVQAHYVAIYGGPDESPVDPLQFSPPRGLFVLGLVGDESVAMGGWRWRPDLDGRFDSVRVAEVKRMFVSTTVRGRGFARGVLAHLESTARSAGVEQLVLETGTMQPDAIALYESSGYERVVPFGHYATSDLVRCFGKHLASVAGHEAVREP